MTDSPLTIVIVGGVAGGASAATRARRLNEEADIILFEKDEYVSFANCGLPYFLGGDIADRNKLLVATADFLRRRFRLDVRTRQEVMGIDRTNRTVTVKNHADGTTYEQRYSRLILAPGASPIVPPIQGADAPNVLALRNLHDMDRIDVAIKAAKTKQAAVVGAGYIGLEMAEQLTRRGLEVSLVELQPQVLPLLDREMAQPLKEELQRNHVRLHVGTALKRVITDRDGLATAVELDNGQQFDTSLVVLGIGVRPNHQLARDAGLETGPDGGIITNRYMQTNDPAIYAVGDAVQYVFGPTDEPLRIPLAGPANRAGRLAGEHAVTDAAHPMADVFGTAIVRVFELSAGQTGLSAARARHLGIPARSVTIVANNHAGYYPGATPITLKLVFDPKYGRVLGAQAVGRDGVDKRIDVIATAMSLSATVWDLAGLDLSYAPPFGSAKDPVHMAAFAACNQLDGITDFLDADADLGGMQVLDVRTLPEVQRLPCPGAENVINIPLDELRDRLGELDKSRETAVTCQSSLRAHVASCLLRQAGFERVHVVSGGALVRSRALATD
jgi:NADPH-dependent 2,4-dienoyl-CoA reductase/sulfur reductase-like enzyme/rhodanese-related sulfurtransferase